MHGNAFAFGGLPKNCLKMITQQTMRPNFLGFACDAKQVTASLK